MTDEAEKKPIPECPDCGFPMKATGTKRAQKPRRLFSCMEVSCGNVRLYLRNGEEATF